MNRSVTQEGLTGHFHSISVGLGGIQLPSKPWFCVPSKQKGCNFPKMKEDWCLLITKTTTDHLGMSVASQTILRNSD